MKYRVDYEPTNISQPYVLRDTGTNEEVKRFANDCDALEELLLKNRLAELVKAENDNHVGLRDWKYPYSRDIGEPRYPLLGQSNLSDDLADIWLAGNFNQQ